MRSSLVGVATFLALISLPGESAACSVRGEFCGYPNWASSAFAGPWAITPAYANVPKGPGDVGYEPPQRRQPPAKRARKAHRTPS
jgi:hypothetical protein